MRVALLTVLFLAGCTRHVQVDPSVRLTVTTSPPTVVTIVPPLESGRAPLELGRTPLREKQGAFMGDTVRLVNVERGIEYEEFIAFGAPGELRVISKIFRERRDGGE